MFQGQKEMKLKQNPLQMVLQIFRFHFCAKSNILQSDFRESILLVLGLGGVCGEVDNLTLKKDNCCP